MFQSSEMVSASSRISKKGRAEASPYILQPRIYTISPSFHYYKSIRFHFKISMAEERMMKFNDGNSTSICGAFCIKL